jgi:hypothetical protein
MSAGFTDEYQDDSEKLGEEDKLKFMSILGSLIFLLHASRYRVCSKQNGHKNMSSHHKGYVCYSKDTQVRERNSLVRANIQPIPTRGLDDNILLGRCSLRVSSRWKISLWLLFLVGFPPHWKVLL